MIDLHFEQYQECKMTDMKIVDSYPVSRWTHCTVSFKTQTLPEKMIDPAALVILNESGDVLQIILQEEGCDSPNFQFTENEKEQFSKWIQFELSEG
ncbi:hypothetical protein [Bacillus solitudinis]|uniref:hypothetical protein n=1 Tax=Bacillus solitudinis TaxID=2014074 RepID=UPI000C23985D|nr:hypothetical protein [Bacillus solitudinis]